MNLRQVFVSVLLFGVAGLLLFMYLQAWIEGQHTESGKKLQQETINQDFSLEPPGMPRKAAWRRSAPVGFSSREMAVSSSRHRQGGGGSWFRGVYLPPALHPLNKTFIKGDEWQDIDSIQEKRRAFLQDFCKTYNSRKKLQTHLVHLVSRIYVEDRHKVLYCEVPKAGCSNWKRVLMVLSGLAASANNISHDDVHYGKHLRKLDSYDLKGIYTRLNTYTKFIFVRDPMERLVSAFRDKFEHPNSYYHPVFGKAIIKKYRHNADEEALKTGSGVKFKEFIQYLLDSHRPVGMDIHWEQVSKLCYPCLINYDFIGRFETLEEDANYFLQLVGAPAHLKFPKFKDRHSSDERTSAEVVRQYLKELSKEERQLTYDFYHLDYLMFNYTSPLV
ncbi:PREDICTED: LOW QUALITY PROTEIN: carbohydrate sulfotransferase 9 [Corvus brachyrhynchos]|uniref:LOW QUALITY PROTEIN: carbohydrate sulfotransferase 9 n=1 Tax=Corvus brachyrhynchos TaxID=85066 RepID=UPI0008167D7B|nr:PREDICTED: LOW QUALITY PROTEIN: carbohydrate sulfotransferase 9 [Corvus brachyrhynchos]